MYASLTSSSPVPLPLPTTGLNKETSYLVQICIYTPCICTSTMVNDNDFGNFHIHDVSGLSTERELGQHDLPVYLKFFNFGKILSFTADNRISRFRLVRRGP